MHPNPIYRKASDEENLSYARAQSFGMLAVCGSEVPLISHIPFLLSQDGGWVEFHLVRSNPIVRIKAPLRARLAIQGPHGYVSPDWYGVADQVPTWNYIAVHLLGEVELRPADELRDLLDRQSALFEGRLMPKPPWQAAKMTPDVLHRLMRQIVPCRMRVDKVEGTWKLNQNKPDAVRLSAARNIENAGLGSETAILAAMMQDVSAQE